MHDPQRQPPATPLYCLSRTVRFNLPFSGALDETLDVDPAIDYSGGSNGEGGKPPMRGFGAHYAFEVRCVGVPDPETGYLINIKEIDRAVRSGIVPRIARAARDGASPASLVPALLAEAGRLLPVAVRSVALRLSPTLRVEAMVHDANGESPDTNSSETERAMPTETASLSPHVIVRQMLEFSAAHRLHVPSLDDDENARIFGKCNNPAGHGHNYRIEPSVEVDPERPISVDAIERITDAVVIERFDHKHLNEQTEEFASQGGLNPSVENIARVCFGLLDRPIADAGGMLRAVTVWETDRTSCTYPA